MDLQEAFEKTQEAAIARDRSIRNWIKATWVFFLVFSVVILISIGSLSTALGRRSPTLAYLKCHDGYEATRDAAQTDFLLALIDAGDDVTPQEIDKLIVLRKNYEQAEKDLTSIQTSTSPCPTLPE